MSGSQEMVATYQGGAALVSPISFFIEPETGHPGPVAHWVGFRVVFGPNDRFGFVQQFVISTFKII